MLAPIGVFFSYKSLSLLTFRPAHSPAQKGAAWAEFMIFAPLAMLFMFGIISLGDTVSRLFSFSNLGYEAALAGGSATERLGLEAMQSRYDTLRDIQNSDRNASKSGNAQFLTGVGYSTYNANPSTRMVVSHSSGSSSNIVNYLNKTLTMRYSAPIVVKEPDPSALNLQTFDNPDNCFWDCAGVSCNATASTTACWLPPPQGSSGGGNPCAGCFSGETPITMADGTQKAINKLELGESVLAFDEMGKTQGVGKITKLYNTRTAPRYFILNGNIKVTPGHLIYVEGKWVPVKDLKLGDKFLTIMGKVVTLDKIEPVEEELKIFNITVEPQHNFYAAGILVHNTSGGPCSGYSTTKNTGNT